MIFLFEKNIRFLTRRRIKYIRLQETDKRTFLIWKTILHERKGISKYSFRVIFHKYTGHPLSFSSFHDSLQYRYIYTHIQVYFFEAITFRKKIFRKFLSERVLTLRVSNWERTYSARLAMSGIATGNEPMYCNEKNVTFSIQCFL